MRLLCDYCVSNWSLAFDLRRFFPVPSRSRPSSLARFSLLLSDSPACSALPAHQSTSHPSCFPAVNPSSNPLAWHFSLSRPSISRSIVAFNPHPPNPTTSPSNDKKDKTNCKENKFYTLKNQLAFHILTFDLNNLIIKLSRIGKFSIVVSSFDILFTYNNHSA